MHERTNEPVDAPIGDSEGFEGGKTAPGDATGGRGQLGPASGGYGSPSGTASSGGSGDGDPESTGEAGDGAIDDGTATSPTGATGQGPTSWVRDA